MKYTVEEARKRHLMARIVQRMQQRGAVMALDLWHANVLSALQERAEEERRKAVMQRVVTRMLHAAVAAGFGRWADNVRELRRQQWYRGESSDADEKRGRVCCSATMARKHDGEEGNGGQVYAVSINRKSLCVYLCIQVNHVHACALYRQHRF